MTGQAAKLGKRTRKSDTQSDYEKMVGAMHTMKMEKGLEFWYLPSSGKDGKGALDKTSRHAEMPRKAATADALVVSTVNASEVGS